MHNEDKQDGQERYENELTQLLTVVRVLKREKKNAKSNLTPMLNQLAVSISEENYDKRSVTETIERLEKLRDEVMRILEELETFYSKLQDEENERKTSKEIEEINEQVDRELGQTRCIILTHVSSLCQERNVVSREKEYVHSVRETERSGGDKRESNRVQREERRIVDSPEHLYSLTPTRHRNNLHAGDTFSSSNVVNGRLERIKIPLFSGNKLEFPRWHAAFSRCVDSSSLSAQFKMLRLEGCLTSQAAETIEGLGYSGAAYEAAKARLLRKYGGSRRQLQGNLEELKKMKTRREYDAKGLERFADALERAVINLKENDRQSDLRDGTLYTIILDKIPERLLALY